MGAKVSSLGDLAFLLDSLDLESVSFIFTIAFVSSVFLDRSLVVELLITGIFDFINESAEGLLVLAGSFDSLFEVSGVGVIVLFVDSIEAD